MALSPNPQNRTYITQAIGRRIAQITTTDDVNGFFSWLRNTGEVFINPPTCRYRNLHRIGQQDQYGFYGHPDKLLSDLATDSAPRATQHAYHIQLDRNVHELVVTANIKHESDYADEENKTLQTYYITSHKALWANNLTFTGTDRPPTSRVRLPISAWGDF